MRTIGELSTTQKKLYNTGEVIVALDELHKLVLFAETGQRGYLLTEDEEYLTPYTHALDKVSEQMVTVKALESEVSGQSFRIEKLEELVTQKLAELVKTVDLALEKKEIRALRLVMSGRGRNLYKEIRSEFLQIKNAEIDFRNTLYSDLQRIEKEAKYTFAISGITSALLLLGIAVLGRINSKNALSYRADLEKQNQALTTKVEERTQELTLYSDELARSNRELEDFAFVASHDLQEPLRKIRAFGDRLDTKYSKEIDATGADYIKRMRNAAERMSNLINDLLEFSRISTRGKEFIDVPLSKIVAEVIDDLEISIEESKAQLNIAELPELKADPGQMQQLFLNLLSNAIKFRKPELAPIIRLEYSSQSINGQTWHSIDLFDNGIGFEQEFADKIFIPFQRLHARTEYKGTGIGLAVCRRIVERHGGKISAQSKPNVGTHFNIQIPENTVLFSLDGEQKNDV